MARMRTAGILVVLLMVFSAAAFAAAMQVCTKCSAKISDSGRKFSVLMPKVPGMEESSFDDIGCAVVWRNGECATRQMTFDSHALAFDYVSNEQVVLENAFFAVGSGIKTPANYDIAAFKDKQAAENRVKTAGKGNVYRLFELVDLPLK